MFYSAAGYWGNRLCFGLILTAAVTLSLAPLAWAEPLRELRDCATCPALIEVPAGTFERLDRLGGPTFWVHFERPYAIGKYTVTRADCGGIGMMGREDLLSTTPVGTYEPNAFGLYDMMGNVAQWVADCANPSFAEAP